MGTVREIVALLPIIQHLHHPVRIKGALGDDATDQQMDLRQRQGRSVFFSRPWSRTMNESARITKVI
jgi:hypothetical protein